VRARGNLEVWARRMSTGSDSHSSPSDFDFYCYVGCYSLGWEDGIPVDPLKRGHGIYITTFNSTTGEMCRRHCHRVEDCNGNENPSYLAIGCCASSTPAAATLSWSGSQPGKKYYLYAAHEWEDSLPGAVSSFRVDSRTGLLETVSSGTCR